jgi:hypothetical protein
MLSMIVSEKMMGCKKEFTSCYQSGPVGLKPLSFFAPLALNFLSDRLPISAIH